MIEKLADYGATMRPLVDKINQILDHVNNEKQEEFSKQEKNDFYAEQCDKTQNSGYNPEDYYVKTNIEYNDKSNKLKDKVPYYKISLINNTAYVKYSEVMALEHYYEQALKIYEKDNATRLLKQLNKE